MILYPAIDLFEGQAVDSIDVAKILYNDNLTPGQYALQLLERKQKNLPDFYRSDLQSELYKVLDFQKQFYPEILSLLFNHIYFLNRLCFLVFFACLDF